MFLFQPEIVQNLQDLSMQNAAFKFEYAIFIDAIFLFKMSIIFKGRFFDYNKKMQIKNEILR